MIPGERFPISELVRRSGVPAASVHHYRRLGLLPPAKRASRNRFLYDERHVRALRLVRLLRGRRGLALPVIRRLLPELLALEEAEAFRPEMWDRLVDLRTIRSGRRPAGLRLLDAGVEAFGRHGYAEVNVEDLCRLARIAKGSFYHHYRSKEDLFVATAEAAAARAAEAFAADAAAGGDEGAAAAALANAIEPFLRIFLDLFAWAVQGRPRSQAVARRVFGGLVERVGYRVSPDDPRERGVRLLQGALAVLLRRAMASPARPAPAVGAAPSVVSEP